MKQVTNFLMEPSTKRVHLTEVVAAGVVSDLHGVAEKVPAGVGRYAKLQLMKVGH